VTPSWSIILQQACIFKDVTFFFFCELNQFHNISVTANLFLVIFSFN